MPELTSNKVQSHEQGGVINVRQREYAIAEKGASSEVLISKNFTSCIGLIGTDQESGVAFLCHFDMLFGTCAINDLARDLIEKGYDPSRFNLYTVRGFHWSLLVVLSMAVIVTAWYKQYFFLLAPLIFFLYWISTPIFMCLQLWKGSEAKWKLPKPLSRPSYLEHALGLFGFCHVKVVVGEDAPKPWSTLEREDYELFNQDRRWLDWRLMKAGSRCPGKGKS